MKPQVDISAKRRLSNNNINWIMRSGYKPKTNSKHASILHDNLNWLQIEGYTSKDTNIVNINNDLFEINRYNVYQSMQSLKTAHSFYRNTFIILAILSELIIFFFVGNNLWQA